MAGSTPSEAPPDGTTPTPRPWSPIPAFDRRFRSPVSWPPNRCPQLKIVPKLSIVRKLCYPNGVGRHGGVGWGGCTPAPSIVTDNEVHPLASLPSDSLFNPRHSHGSGVRRHPHPQPAVAGDRR